MDAWIIIKLEGGPHNGSRILYTGDIVVKKLIYDIRESGKVIGESIYEVGPDYDKAFWLENKYKK